MSEFLDTIEKEYFEDALVNYEMNEGALRTFAGSNFAVIAGPAGAGKDTIRNKLIADNPAKYARVISTTTRDPRPGEHDGIDYHFRQINDIKDGLDKGKFFQAALVHNQQVSCLSIEEIEKLQSDQIGISILIVQTEAELSNKKANIKTAFVVPPSLDELIRRMNIGRMLTDEETDRRLKAAYNELSFALKDARYQCVVNDNLAEACRIVNSFLESGTRDDAQDNKARGTIELILRELG